MGGQLDLIATAAVPAVTIGIHGDEEPGEAYFENTVKLMGGEYNGAAFGSNFIVPGVEGIDYPTGIEVLNFVDIYISCDYGTNLIADPAGITVNHFINNTVVDVRALVDADGEATTVTFGLSEAVLRNDDAGADTGNNSGFLTDTQFNTRWHSTADAPFDVILGGLEAGGEYTIKISGSLDVSYNANYNTAITIGADTQVYNITTDDGNTSTGTTHTAIVPDGSGNITITVDKSSSLYAVVGGITIIRTA